MAGGERPGDHGRRRGADSRRRVGRELRIARNAAGLSLRAVGSAARVDHTRISRFERGLDERLALDDVGAIAGVIGLDLVVRTYPAGDPIRDVAHARLLGRLRRELHPTLRWRTEVPFPNEGDLRAWDALTGATAWRAGIEAETVIDDTQALDRRIALKRRDGGVDLVILLVADTPRNRRALTAASSAFTDLPLRNRALLGALRSGERPHGSGIVLL